MPKNQIKFQFQIKWGLLCAIDMVYIYDTSLFRAIQKLNEFYFRTTILKCWNAQFTPPVLIPEIENIYCPGNMPIFEQIVLRAKNIQLKKRQKR